MDALAEFFGKVDDAGCWGFDSEAVFKEVLFAWDFDFAGEHFVETEDVDYAFESDIEEFWEAFEGATGFDCEDWEVEFSFHLDCDHAWFAFAFYDDF